MADTRATLRPNATRSNSAVIVGGSATAHAAWSDNSDGTYLQYPGSQRTEVDLDDIVIPAGAIIRQARGRLRGRSPTGSLTRLAFELQDSTGGWTSARDVTSTAFIEILGDWSTTRRDGQPYTVEDINYLWVNFRRNSGADLEASEFYVDVDYNERPVATLTAPTGTVNSSTPTAQWTYSDPNGDAQTHFQIVVESGDHTLDSAPDLTNNKYNSGEIASSSTSHQLPALEEATYTVWVRVRQADVNGQELRSVWNSELFTVDVLPPAVPTLTATADNVNKRVELTTDSNSVAGQEAEKYWVQYSDDGGANWFYVRGGNPVTVDPVDSPETIYDNESPPNTARQYRARASRTDAGNAAYSNWSATASATVTSTEWWLKDVLDPSNNMVIEVENDPWDIEHPADIAVFNPLGRRYPVVVREATVKAARFSLDIPTIDAATYASLERLWESGHPMLLQVPGADKQYYVQFNSPRMESMRNLNDPYRGNTLEFVEIERPTV